MKRGHLQGAARERMTQSQRCTGAPDGGTVVHHHGAPRGKRLVQKQTCEASSHDGGFGVYFLDSRLLGALFRRLPGTSDGDGHAFRVHQVHKEDFSVR